ncbi:MAG TPA: Ku protein [Burkholderiales bacterium]|jgi:DNA end-binding protein Ku|nr:Ku protein [Burkholderiales bacterium]
MRPLWTGAISFGLVNVPVSLYSATRHHSLDFDMLDKRDMQPVGYQRINKETGKAVPWEEVVKGYEYEKGRYVVMTEADFKAANVEATQTIDIVSFVEAQEIPVVYFDTPYYLAPARGGAKGYSLLLETLEHAEKAAIGQVVIRTRQHLAAIVPDQGLLVLCTLRYGYEIRGRDEIAKKPAGKKGAVTRKEVEMALQLVEQMSESFAPRKYKDTYRDDILARVKKKVRAGKSKKLEEPGEAHKRESADVIDLMAALKRSLKGKEGAKHSEKARRRASS